MKADAMTMKAKDLMLIGDIGGTNCRLALAHNGQLLPESITTYADDAYPSLIDAIRAYLREQRASEQQIEISIACMAIAGPITGDMIKLTNHAWHFSIEQTRIALNLTALEIINDFEAIALALPHLRQEHLQQIGGTEPQLGKPKVAMGPGTGYGAAQVVHCGKGFIALPTEGGHVSLVPSTPLEVALCAWLMQENLQMTREQLLSGPGLERIYRGLCVIDGMAADTLCAADIQTRAVANSDPYCVNALTLFCELLGTAARDQALDFLAQGGVYIAGGIVKRFIPFLRASGFRQRFENSTTMRALLEPIPVYVITEENPGLMGAAAHAAALSY
jgi:glucokinase